MFETARFTIRVGTETMIYNRLAQMALFLAISTNVKELTLEYKSIGGVLRAVVHNGHRAAATAYIAEAFLQTREGERLNAFGGDSLAYPDGGGIEVPSSTTKTMNDSLPPGSSPDSTGFSAAVYADGFTEGDEDIVAMILGGRQRSLSDLNECLPALAKAAKAQGELPELLRKLEAIRKRDETESAKLDGMTARSGLRYRFFMTAVPDHALEELNAASSPADVKRVLQKFDEWKRKLEQSRPSLR